MRFHLNILMVKRKLKHNLKKNLTAEFGSEKAKDLMERYDNGDIVSPIQEAIKEDSR